MSAPTYIIYNSAMATTAAPVAQPTGSAIRTMLQIKPATGIFTRAIAWGVSFDGAAAAAGGKVELIETDVACTITTACVAGDIQPYGNYQAPANTAGTSGAPFNLGTSATGYASAAGTEGTITATRMADMQIIQPTNQYSQQWPLSREFELTPQKFLRVRVTFGTSVNMFCWVLIEV